MFVLYSREREKTAQQNKNSIKDDVRCGVSVAAPVSQNRFAMGDRMSGIAFCSSIVLTLNCKHKLTLHYFCSSAATAIVFVCPEFFFLYSLSTVCNYFLALRALFIIFLLPFVENQQETFSRIYENNLYNLFEFFFYW